MTDAEKTVTSIIATLNNASALLTVLLNNKDVGQLDARTAMYRALNNTQDAAARLNCLIITEETELYTIRNK